MKPTILAAILTASLLLVPIAHAQTGPVPIGNPEVNTLQLWESITASIEGVAQEAITAAGQVASTVQKLAAAVAQHSSQSATQASAGTAQAASPAVTVASFQVTEEASSTAVPPPSETPASGSSNARPIVERITEYEPLASSSFVTQNELTSQLQQLTNELASKISSSDGLTVSAWAPSQAIDQLDNVTITNANLTASEIPALDYLSLSGGSLSGNLTVSGNATTTGTSYFTGNIGIGTSTSQDALAVNGSEYLPDITAPALTTNRLYANTGGLYWGGNLVAGAAVGNWASNGTNVWRAGGFVGIGTTSPSYALDVNGVARASVYDLGGGTYNVKAYGAKGDGTTDDTAAINAAINAASAAGGGTVYLPPTGHAYIISNTLAIPDGVELEGAGTKTFQGEEAATAQWTAHGTWLEIASSSVPAVSLTGHGSAIDGVNFIGLNGAQWNPIPSEAWTITVSADAFSISNVLILNRANGIDVQYSFGHGGGTYSYIDNVWFNCYQVGLALDKVNDNLDLDELHFRNIVGMDQNSAVNYLLNNFIAMDIGDYDNPAISNIDIFAAHIGMYFYNDQALSSDTPHSLVNATVSNIGFNLVDQAMVVASATTTVTGQFSNVMAQGAASNVGTIDLNDTLFWLRSDNVNLRFSNLSVPDTGGAVMELGNGAASGALAIIDGAQISNWSNTGTSTNAFIVYPNAQLTLGANDISATGHSAYTTVGSGDVVMDDILSDNGSNDNVGVGVSALSMIASGTQDTAVGYHAGEDLISNGTAAAFGAFAMQNHTGNQNTAIGALSLEAAGAGSNNTVLGFQAGNSDTSGVGNVFLGWNAASTTQTGSNNIALGYGIALPSANGSNQLDIGNLIYGTGINGQGTAISTGSIGIGTSTPTALLTLDSSSASGTVVRISNSSTGGHIYDLLSTGSGNTGGAGRLDLFDYTAGVARLSIASNGNIGIGTTTPGSIFSVNNVLNLTAATSTFYSTGGINLTAGCFAIAGNCLSLGNISGTLGATQGGTGVSSFGGTNTVLYTTGTNTLGSNPGLTFNGTQFSNTAGTINTSGTAGGYDIDGNLILQASTTNFSTLVGNGAGVTLLSAADYNTALGYQALGDATSSQKNVAIGYEALLGSATVSNAGPNTAVGYKALSSDTSGTSNTAVGNNALSDNMTGGSNSAFGNNALLDSTGGSNTAMGQNADQYDNGNNDVAIGLSADGGGSGSAASHSNNTAIGFEAGYDISTGGDNIFLGYETASTSQTGSNNIALGYDVALPSTNGSNQLDIGNLLFGTGINGQGATVSTGNIGIGTTTPYSRLTVWGTDTASTSAFAVVNSASTTEFSVYDTGNAVLSGGLTQNSDQRLKTNIQSLSASSSLSLIDELNPVTFNWIDPNKGTTPQLGFIAQQVQPIFPNLVSTTSATALTPDGTLSLNYIDLISPIVSAIQALSSEITSIENTIASFSTSFATGELTYTRADGVTTNTQTLCLTDGLNDQSPVCITKAQLAAILAGTVQSSDDDSNDDSSSNTTSSSNTPPVIQINGDIPAVVQVGDTYNDLGATITGPQADLNLGITTYVNGIETSPVQIDTSAAATDTIDYVVTDQNGLTSTSTRTVIIEASPSIVPTDNASTSATTAAS